MYRSNTRRHAPLMTASAAFNPRPFSHATVPSSGKLTKRPGLKKGQRFRVRESASPPTNTAGWNSRICAAPSKPSSYLRTLPITKYPAGAAQKSPRNASILLLPKLITSLLQFRLRGPNDPELTGATRNGRRATATPTRIHAEHQERFTKLRVATTHDEEALVLVAPPR